MAASHSVVAAVLLWWAALAAAHPFHISYGEADWNKAGDTLEISLRVIPEDLEVALAQRLGRAVVLAEDAQLEPLIEAYLQDNFQLRTSSGELLPVALLGMEISYDATWLYFTVAASVDQHLTLANRVIQDVDTSQVNRLRRLWAKPADVLIFSYGSPEQEFWAGK